MQNDKIDFGAVDWQGILSRLGVDAKIIANPKKRGPCPIEQTGTTRFRFDNKEGRGTWVCNCGAGDGVRLVGLLTGKSDAEAVLYIREMLYGRPALIQQRCRPACLTKTPQEIAKARRNLERIWRQSTALPGTPAWTYLSQRVRGLSASWLSRELRYHPELHHWDDENGAKSMRPALVCRVVDAHERKQAVTLHRTYLTMQGEKAPVSPSQVKKVMPATVDKITGEAIRVNNVRTTRLVIVAEGVESALAWVAATENRYAVFAALNCFAMGRFTWPKGAEALLIASDNDAPNPTTGLRPGLHHASVLRQRAQAAGLRCRVVVPPTTGVDFDDLWNSGEAEIFSLSKRIHQAA